VYAMGSGIGLSGKTYPFRFVGKFAAPNERIHKWEYSKNGKNCMTYSEGKMTKK
jgi:hypothetical protein